MIEQNNKSWFVAGKTFYFLALLYFFFVVKTITPKNPTPLQAHWKSNANWGTALILLMALIWGLVAVPKMITDKILIGDEIIEFEDLTVEFENDV